MTVTGFGFSKNTTVTIGSEECKVIHASDSELKCRTPAVSVQTVKNTCHTHHFLTELHTKLYFHVV